MTSKTALLTLTCLTPLLMTCATTRVGNEKPTTGLAKEGTLLDRLHEMRSQFADVEITVDAESIRPDDMKVLPHLIRAASVMDRLFWKQATHDGWAIRSELAKKSDELSRITVEMMDINFGPYDRLKHYEPFYGDQPRQEGATFYPRDMTAAEFEKWIADHPGDREAFQSWLTIIRRDGDNLVAIPYSEHYKDDLQEAAEHLRAAAAATRDTTLAKFLESRAAAFESNDYLQSDMDWMDLGETSQENPSGIEVVIGPYEVYEDSLLGLKSAFESFVTVVDENDSRKLSTVGQMLDELEANLPMPDHHKNFTRGKTSPIKVVNVVYTAGDTKAGVQTAAFNLPNDERVRSLKGSKKVMLKNVMRAKFDKALIPISNMLVDQEILKNIDFDAYFNFILMHEVSHGLGPGIISRPDGSKTTVNLALKDTYAAIEECKADILSVYNTMYMADKGMFDKDFIEKTEASYLAGIFRSVRFGINEAHGSSNIMQFNYLREKNAITFDRETGRFGIDSARFVEGVVSLATEILAIEAAGDYEAAQAMVRKYVYLAPEVENALGRLSEVPVDIRPIFTLGNKLLSL